MRSVQIQDKRIVDYLATYYSGIDDILQVIATPPPLTTLRINTNIVSTPADKEKLVEELKSSLPEGQFELIESPAKIPNTIGIFHPHKEKSDVDELTIPTHPLVVVDARCGESVLRGADIFVPGVVSVAKGINCGDTVSIDADINEVLRHGEDPERLSGSGIYVGDGITQLPRNEILCNDNGVAVTVVKRVGRSTSMMPSLNGVLEGKIFLQNISSMIAALSLSPTPGSRVLDMCAAPGGKTTHIAELMGNNGEIVAIDRSKARAEELRTLCSKMNAQCVNVHAADSKSLKKLYPDDCSFDYVLLDAPCSGIGLRPRLVEKSTFEDFSLRGPYQRKLFREAYRLLRKGGALVFSTCTLNPDEGEAVVKFALEEFDDLVLVDALPESLDGELLGECGVAGAGLSDEQRRMVRRFVPRSGCGNIIQNTSAFFVAKFYKKE